MKKAIIILCTLLILVLTGCGSNQSNRTSANKNSDNGNHLSAATAIMPLIPYKSESPAGASKTHNIEASQKDDNEILSINGVVSDYNIIKSDFDKNSNDIKIFFPQVNGLSDKTKQEKINGLIRNAVLVDNQDNINLYKDDLSLYRSFDLNYTLMWTSNNLLSVLFYGYFDEKQAPHPNNVIYTVNINMKTGSILKLSDILNSNNDFIQLFINKSQFVGGGTTLDFEAIKRDYFNADKLKLYFDNYQAYYFTSSGVVFTISTWHGIGDYSLFSLNFSDISKYIKQNSQWEDIKSDFPPANFQIIRDQCFKTALAGLESTWFISGFDKSSNGILTSLKFYLLGSNGNVKYEFPDFICSNLGYYGIRAVAFNDVNHDGKKDVIIIAALNQIGEVEYDEAKVYLSTENNFSMDRKLNSCIDENLKATKTVSDVLAAAKNYFK